MQPNPVLKKLGFTNTDRLVILHTDDVGMCQASLAAFIDLWENRVHFFRSHHAALPVGQTGRRILPHPSGCRHGRACHHSGRVGWLPLVSPLDT
jgi:hypothetical protein